MLYPDSALYSLTANSDGAFLGKLSPGKFFKSGKSFYLSSKESAYTYDTPKRVAADKAIKP